MAEMGKRILRSFRTLFWILLITGAVGFLGYRVVAAPPKPEPPKSVAAIRAEKGIPVVVHTVEAGPWNLWKRYYGQVKSASEQSVTSFLREYIVAVHVHVGDLVKAGDVLLELSRETSTPDFAARSAEYEDAKRDYERLKALYDAGGTSKAEVDRAAVAMQQKGSALKETRTQLARTKVASKLTGVVSLRNAEVGEISETGRELLRVVDLRNLEADVLVPPGDVARVAKGTPARVVLEGRRHNGTVKRVDPGADVATGLYRVVVALPPDTNLRPGMFVETELLVDPRTSVVSVPYEALRRDNGRTYVYVLSGDVARLRDVEVGEGQGGLVEVVSRLYEGEIIAVRGVENLYDGARVWLQSSAPEEASPDVPVPDGSGKDSSGEFSAEEPVSADTSNP
jgi:membrane fusion protein (multidrug efflux system)